MIGRRNLHCDHDPGGAEAEGREAPPPATERSEAAGSPPGAPAEPLPPPLHDARLRGCIEALLFATAEPIPRKRLRRILADVDPADIDDALLSLEADLAAHGHGFSLVEDAAGLQLLSKAEFAPYVERLRGEKRIRLSQAAFETLAVIAYRQPIRRADLESVRGVQCGPVLKNLSEWGLIKIVGRDEALGRPLLYGTTVTFLEQFGLSDLDALPAPDQLRELGGEQGVEVTSDEEENPPSPR